jgi:adhesin/invasin
VPGAANASHSTFSVAPGSLTANGSSTSTVTVRAKDVHDNNLTAGGDTVLLATDLGSLSAVTDNGDGTYTATYTSATTTGTAHVTGTLNGNALTASTTVTLTPGAANAAHSTFSAAPSSLTANGTSTATVTVRAKDLHDNNLTAGSDTVALATDLGSLSSVTDNGDGTYTATYTSATSTGTAHLTGTVNGSALTATTITLTPGAANAAHSTLNAAPSSLTANGSSTATVTVRAKDLHDNNLTAGSDTVSLTTDLGALSSVTDNNDGTYTATLTSATTTGTAHLTGTLNGSALTATTVTLVPGPASAAHTTIAASPTSVVAGTSSTVTVTVHDAHDNQLAMGGTALALASDLGAISSVTDNGDGTYTATLTTTTSGTAHITGTVGGTAIGAPASVTISAAAPDAGQSTVVATSGSVSTDSAGTTITVTAKDAFGNLVANANVTLAAGSGSSSISPVLGTTTNASGVATFTVSDTVAEPVTYSATAAGTLVTQTAGVQFQPGTAVGTTTTIAAAPTSLTAGSNSTITVHAKDQHGNALTSGGATVTVATDHGSLTSVTDNGNGTYTATLSSLLSGTAHVSGTIGGASITATASVVFVPGAANAAHTTISATPSVINSDGSSGTSTVTVRLKDVNGNSVTAGGPTVQLATSRGSLSSVTDNNDGTYTAALTATGTNGAANITGTLDGTTIGNPTSVTFTPPVPVAHIDSGPGGTVTSSANANLTFSSTNDPDATFECKLDGSAYTSCTSPQTLTGLADGAHTFSVRGVDVNGTGAAVSATWTVDTTSPTVSLTVAPPAYTNGTSASLAATATDATSGVIAVDFRYGADAASCPTGTTIFTDLVPPYTATWTLPPDGSYAVCAVATDAATNHSTADVSSVVVDVTKPTLSLSTFGTLVGSDRYARADVSLHATSRDVTSGVATVSFGRSGTSSGPIDSVTGAGTPGTTDPYTTTWATGSLADGPYTVTASSTDKAGNAETAAQAVILDNTPPTASLDDPGSFAHGTIPLSVTASDTGSGVDSAATVIQASTDGGSTWTAVGSPTTWTPADATYTLRAQVRDNVGNQTTTATRTIVVDNTAPTVSDDADTAWHRTDVTLNLTAADAESGVAGVEYKVDSGSWTTGTSVTVPSTAGDGTHTVTYRATNRAGVTSADATATVKIDTTPPNNVTLDAPAAASILRGTVSTLSATAQDATSGVASTVFRITAGTLGANPCDTFGTAISAPFDTTSIADGHYDLWVAAVDAAGNGRCSVVPHDVVIDNTAPVTTNNAPAGPQNHDVSVTLGATDGLTGVASTEYSLDGGSTWTSGTLVTILASSGDGVHTIQYRSRDNAGNVEAIKSTSVTIDTTAPGGTAGDPGSYLAGTVQLSYSPTSADIASVQFGFRPSGSSGAYAPIGAPVTSAPYNIDWLTTAVADGSYDIEVLVTDSAGNTSSDLLSAKTVDNTAPSGAAMTAPLAGSDVAGTIALGATAADATSGVATVAFQIKATGDASFTTVDADTNGAPFTGTWNTIGKPDGPAEAQVVVTDRAGNTFTSATVSFTIDNTAPSVTVTAPAATNGAAALAATGSADIQTVKYEISAHGLNTWTTVATVGTPFGASWASGTFAEGLYDVRATATDGGGNTGTGTTTVLVDRTAPIAAFTQPGAAATVGGATAALAATASDTGSGVSTVTFQVRPNGSIGAFTDIATDTTAPFAATWDTTALASGQYELRVLTTDVAGNSATVSRVVTVDSTPPAVSSFSVASPASGSITLNVTTDADATAVTYGISPAGAGTWTQVATSSTAPSFGAALDTTAFADGTYDLRAIVRDAYGNSTTATEAGVLVDNTAPAMVSSVPGDGSIVIGTTSVDLTTSEDIGAVTDVRLDGLPATFTWTIAGSTATFWTGSLTEGNHAITGSVRDLAGNTGPFRVNVTVQGTPGATHVPATSKNVSPNAVTTLDSADSQTTVTVPAGVWTGAHPSPQDFLVLKVDPNPAPAIVPHLSVTPTSDVVDVRLFWNLAATDVHAFDAPIELTLPDPAGNGTPVTAEPGAAWRGIPALATAGSLPAAQPDGYWRVGSTVHILTRHLSFFTILGQSAATVQIAPPIDFAAVLAADGLTLRWVYGIPSDQVANFTLYADGVGIGTFGQREFEAKLGGITADDTRRFTITETALDGRVSAPSPTVLRAVPPVAGMTVAQATAALAGRNFTAGRQIPVAAMGVAPGTVVGPTDTSVLAEGSAIDLQIATNVVARSPFSFAVADAPQVKVIQSQLIGRMLLTTAGRIDVTLDAYPYKRIQRWHFFHVKAGETILRMKLRHPLKSGTYRLFWKATSAADHTVLRPASPPGFIQCSRAARRNREGRPRSPHAARMNSRSLSRFR